MPGCDHPSWMRAQACWSPTEPPQPPSAPQNTLLSFSLYFLLSVVAFCADLFPLHAALLVVHYSHSLHHGPGLMRKMHFGLRHLDTNNFTSADAPFPLY